MRFVPPLVRVDQGGVKTHRLLADVRVQVDGVSQRMGKYGLVLGYNCLEVSKIIKNDIMHYVKTVILLVRNSDYVTLNMYVTINFSQLMRND